MLFPRLRYDTQNRLIEVALAQTGATEQVIARYGYDPQDRRIWKEQYASKSGEPLFLAQRTLYLYSDQGLLAEATQTFVLDLWLTHTTVDVPPGVITGPRPVITGPLQIVAGVAGVSGATGVSNLPSVPSVPAAPMAISSGVAVATTSGIRLTPSSAVVQAASPSPRAPSTDGGEAINIGPVAPTITTQYGLPR